MLDGPDDRGDDAEDGQKEKDAGDQDDPTWGDRGEEPRQEAEDRLVSRGLKPGEFSPEADQQKTGCREDDRKAESSFHMRPSNGQPFSGERRGATRVRCNGMFGSNVTFTTAIR